MKKLLIVGFTLLSACSQRNDSFNEVRDKDIAVQIMKLENTGSNVDIMSYKVRLIPEEKLMKEKSQDVKNALWYKMDSCFYLQKGGKKIYANMVQPIANGVTGTFEYLLDFETENTSGLHGNLVYQDKYINQHQYQLKLDKE